MTPPTKKAKAAPKKNNKKKERKQYTIEEKAELLQRVENGTATKAQIVHETGMSWSTFSTMYKDRQKFFDAVAGGTAPGVTKVNKKQRAPLADKMEVLLLAWVEEKNIRHEPVSKAMVQEKARRIYKDLAEEQAKEEARARKAEAAAATGEAGDSADEAADADEAAAVDEGDEDGEDGGEGDSVPEFAGKFFSSFFTFVLCFVVRFVLRFVSLRFVS
jgi:hypothetical protein